MVLVDILDKWVRELVQVSISDTGGDDCIGAFS